METTLGKQREVVQVAAEHDYYQNIVEIAEYDEDGEPIKWHYKLLTWVYGSSSTKCSWTSPVQLEFADQDDD